MSCHAHWEHLQFIIITNTYLLLGNINKTNPATKRTVRICMCLYGSVRWILITGILSLHILKACLVHFSIHSHHFWKIPPRWATSLYEKANHQRWHAGVRTVNWQSQTHEGKALCMGLIHNLPNIPSAIIIITIIWSALFPIVSFS